MLILHDDNLPPLCNKSYNYSGMLHSTLFISCLAPLQLRNNITKLLNSCAENIVHNTNECHNTIKSLLIIPYTAVGTVLKVAIGYNNQSTYSITAEEIKVHLISNTVTQLIHLEK